MSATKVNEGQYYGGDVRWNPSLAAKVREALPDLRKNFIGPYVYHAKFYKIQKAIAENPDVIRTAYELNRLDRNHLINYLAVVKECQRDPAKVKALSGDSIVKSVRAGHRTLHDVEFVLSLPDSDSAIGAGFMLGAAEAISMMEKEKSAALKAEERK